MEPIPTPTAPGPTDGYEFSPEQNALLLRLASRMQFVGLFALGLGVVAIILGAVRKQYGVMFGGILYAVIGLWTERAGRSFRFIAITEGHDIRHLMHALADLRKLYTVQYWICFAALLAAIVLLGVSIARGVSP
jgi:hypothetical protein